MEKLSRYVTLSVKTQLKSFFVIYFFLHRKYNLVITDIR